MKTILKVLVLAVLFLAVFTAFQYDAGKDASELKKKYSYPESQFVVIDQQEIHVRKTGTGPAVLLLHGVASSLHTWEKWHDLLSPYFSVYSIDVPGFGISGPFSNNDYSVEHYMQFLDALTQQLGIDSLYLAGNSFGGFLSWNYAVHRPDKVKKLILLDAAGFNRSKNEEIKNIGFRLSMNPYTKGVAHKITPKFLVRQSVVDVYGDPSLLEEATVTRYHDMITRKGNREAFSEILINTIHNGEDRTPLLNNITQECLILWGELDNLIPVEHAHQFNKYIPNSDLIIYPGVGHIPMEEIPAKSANDAIRFLKE